MSRAFDAIIHKQFTRLSTASVGNISEPARTLPGGGSAMKAPWNFLRYLPVAQRLIAGGAVSTGRSASRLSYRWLQRCCTFCRRWMHFRTGFPASASSMTWRCWVGSCASGPTSSRPFVTGATPSHRCVKRRWRRFRQGRKPSNVRADGCTGICSEMQRHRAMLHCLPRLLRFSHQGKELRKER